VYPVTSSGLKQRLPCEAGELRRTGRPAYPERCYDFGTRVLQLRTRSRLTQGELAKAVRVHRRSVQNWETGVAYPKVEALQRLIVVFLGHGAFVAGREYEEIADLWALATRNSPDALATFDDAWFGSILAQHGIRGDSDTPLAAASPAADIIDWGEAPDVSQLFGREGELATLERWLVDERCRVVSIVGVGGLGKSSLAVMAAQRFLSRFDLVIFRSLRNEPQPAPAELLDQLIAVISEQGAVPVEQTADKIAQLIQLLRERRCLLILDGVEAIFQPRTLKRAYRDGCAAYELLFKSLGERRHRSCLLLTSRERVFTLGPLEGDAAPVRSLCLRGLSPVASLSVLETRGISGSAANLEALTHSCGGNPLALLLAAEPIRTLFGGNSARFIDSGSSALSRISAVVRQHLERLTDVERVVLEELATRDEPVLIADVLRWGCACIGADDTLLALESLHQRLLIERLDDRLAFVLQPLIRAFLREQRRAPGR
jgi:transcriptional regulator with XRE-family HTH domain